MNEITFDAPDKYDQKVISYRSTFPGTDDGSPMGYITNSFYSPTIEITISPLAPNAFSHYKFRYLGFINYDNLPVNIIEVIPKRKSQQLFSGKIYIVDNLWNLYSVDLVNEAFFGTYHIKQIFAPVKERVWLPVNHFINIDASVFGIKAEFRYSGAVKYKNIEINKDIPVPETLMKQYAKDEETEQDTITQTNESKPLTKNQKKMKQLMAKEDLTNRDMMKIVRLIEKESKSKEKSRSLEVEDNYKFSIKKDSVKRDTAFWNTIRPIPLTGDEVRSFEIKDSVLMSVKNGKNDTISKKKTGFSKAMDIIFSGKKFYACDSSLQIRYNGLITWKVLDFNSVDGWSYRHTASFSYKPDTVHSITFNPFLRYAFNRKKLYWGADAGISYLVKQRGWFNLSFDQNSFDFNRQYGINRTLNSLSSLFFKENYMKLYGDDYISFNTGIDLIHGMRFNLATAFHNYTRLENITNFSFFRQDDDYADNATENVQVTDINLDDQRGFNIKASLSYTPRLKYRIYKGQKNNAGLRLPDIHFQLQKRYSFCF